MPDFDVIVIGAGPAGLYSALVLQRGIPTQSVSEPIRVAVFEQGKVGGLAKYGFITISKQWAFSGSKIVGVFYKECIDAGVHIYERTVVTSVLHDSKDGLVHISTSQGKFTCRYAIITSGIFPNPEALTHKKVMLGLHTPERMIEELKLKNWRKVLLYGPDESSLRYLAEKIRSSEIEIDIRSQPQSYNLLIQHSPHYLPGISEPDFLLFDGILMDYNSYKVVNGSTGGINLPRR